MVEYRELSRASPEKGRLLTTRSTRRHPRCRAAVGAEPNPLESTVRSMSLESNERFVADGGSRWWKSAEGEKVRRQIEATVRSRYRAELERAGWLKQLRLEHRIRREIAAECEKVLWARR